MQSFSMQGHKRVHHVNFLQPHQRGWKHFSLPEYSENSGKCISITLSTHVETVVLLSQLRQKPDDYIDVDIDVAELEGTSAETKATYEKIKKYVAEHNDGMKVSNLYIAQVKRKCGIELAENFNLPKSEDARQPRCPKDAFCTLWRSQMRFRAVALRSITAARF